MPIRQYGSGADGLDVWNLFTDVFVTGKMPAARKLWDRFYGMSRPNRNE